jgi:hypothetical protein
MLKFKKSGLLVLIFSLVGSVSAKVITVVQRSFNNIGGGIGLDDVTISTPPLKTQISSNSINLK